MNEHCQIGAHDWSTWENVTRCNECGEPYEDDDYTERWDTECSTCDGGGCGDCA